MSINKAKLYSVSQARWLLIWFIFRLSHLSVHGIQERATEINHKFEMVCTQDVINNINSIDTKKKTKYWPLSQSNHRVSNQSVLSSTANVLYSGA